MNVSRNELEAAVARGIITREQLDEIIAISAESNAGTGKAEPAIGHEVASGLNAITVAYYAGAVVVLFAFGWFLVERWEALRPLGVLGVTALYAALFAFTARYFTDRGYPHAAAVSTLLVVGMVPIMSWAVMSLAGAWDVPGAATPGVHDPARVAAERTRWIPVELATLAAALLAIRWVRHALLALPAAVAAHAAMVHATPFVVPAAIVPWAEQYVGIFAGSVLLLAGYVEDARKRGGSPDYAFWIYTAAFVLTFVNGVQLWSDAGAWRHLIGPLAVLLAAAALRLRRREFLAAAFVAVIWYLGFLSFSVFRSAIGFPVALATFGISIIIVAVWVQNRFPGLVRARRDQWAPLPGGIAAPVAIVAACAAMFIVSLTSDRGMRAQQASIDRMNRPTAAPDTLPGGRGSDSIVPAPSGPNTPGH
jgi:hypothetical protein